MRTNIRWFEGWVRTSNEQDLDYRKNSGPFLMLQLQWWPPSLSIAFDINSVKTALQASLSVKSLKLQALHSNRKPYDILKPGSDCSMCVRSFQGFCNSLTKLSFMVFCKWSRKLAPELRLRHFGFLGNRYAFLAKKRVQSSMTFINSLEQSQQCASFLHPESCFPSRLSTPVAAVVTAVFIFFKNLMFISHVVNPGLAPVSKHQLQSSYGNGISEKAAFL